jgi:hypothetical protein
MEGEAKGYVSLDQLIEKHKRAKEVKPRKLGKGEARKKLAFLVRQMHGQLGD